MKRYDKIKTLQLVIYILITVIGLAIVFINKDLYYMIATDNNVKLFFFILWAILVLSFVFLFVDFSAYLSLKKGYSELDLAIFSDPITGIANRYSCDAIIDNYADKPLPNDIGCVTFDITNLAEINEHYGRVAGNAAIRDFSSILQSAAIKVCFVGRNGGNKFLAIFQDCSEEKIENFLETVEGKMRVHNEKSKSAEILYKYGTAFNEGEEVKNINQLIALSNRRAIESYRAFVDR